MTTELAVLGVDLIHQPASIEDDNIDAVVRLSNGETFFATFFTLKNIGTIIEGYRRSGECLNGQYFWAKDMVIVDDLRLETIRNVVQHMVSTGEYRHAFGHAQ